MLPYLLAAILGAGGPQGQVTIETDHMTATMTSNTSWTMRTLRCADTPITIDAGGQGAVICPRGGNWLGGGMTEGGEEQVLSFEVTSDQMEATVEGEQTITTSDAVATKTSMIETIEHTAVTRFEDDVIVQEHSFTFTQDLDLKSFYPFIYSFSTEFTEWMALTQEGAEQTGEFAGDGGHLVGTAVAWFALFNPGAGRGVIGYHQRPIGGPTSLWDASGYRKFYVQPMTGEIRAGTELSGTLVLKCFSAEAEGWHDVAKQEVAALQQRFPAEEAPEQPNVLYDEGVPEHGFMTVQTEHLRAVLEASAAWTLDEIWWDDFKVAGPTGHFGTVLVPAGGKWIGTGHTEGGREIVHALRMTVDGEERPVEVGTTVEADTFELVKQSTIHKFDATHTLTITGDEIVERAELRATEDHTLSLMYLFMHCIEPTTSAWAAELPDGTFEEGTFGSDGGFELQRRARWAAQWFPEQGLSVLLYLTRIPDADGAMLRMWDEARYHKVYVQHNRGLELSEGDELDFTLVFTVVEDETGDWSATKRAAEALKADYPPVDPADEG